MNTTPEARTRENFDRLPILLSRAEFLWWSGMSGAELDEGCRDGSIPFRRRKGGGYRKYFKSYLAQWFH